MPRPCNGYPPHKPRIRSIRSSSPKEAILTRSCIPIQDSPGIRITYDAHVTVPPELMAVMSATNPQELSGDGSYRFHMDKAIPRT